jgi:nucleoside-diphosphate-sugar epimerase
MVRIADMRVFVAGATGALGVPVVRRLVDDGHTVIGLARTRKRTAKIESLGAHAVVANALDSDELRNAMIAARPEVVVHALTAIPPRGPLRSADLNATNVLRMTGTKNLLAAAIAAGACRIVAESMVFVYGFGDHGDAALTEDTPVARYLPKARLGESVNALISEEAQILEATRTGRTEGVVLRFGGFYGPDAGTETMIQMLRRRVLPISKQARSRGVPWIHVSDAAAAVVAALSRHKPGQVYNVADDEAVSAGELIAYLADSFHAPRPWSIPVWVTRLTAPFAAAAWLDTTLRVSNAKAKRELGWVPQFPTFRDGIADMARKLGSDSK